MSLDDTDGAAHFAAEDQTPTDIWKEPEPVEEDDDTPAFLRRRKKKKESGE